MTTSNRKCKCACHDNKLKQPYEHDTRCCEGMNGFVVAHTQEVYEVDLGPDSTCTKCGKRLCRCPVYRGLPARLVTDTQEESEGWETRNDLRMEIIHILEEVSGDIWCDCEPVNKVINNVFDRLLLSQKERLEREIEGMMKKHIIDVELYYDSGGGEMCEICGKQGVELDEPCDRNNSYNEALADVLSLIRSLK